jgi:hypothetical protein
MSQTEHQLSLSLFYKGWDVYQQQLVAAIILGAHGLAAVDLG